VDGTGAAAAFNNPQGMVVTGGVGYVLDTGSLRRVDLASGATTTLAGTGVGQQSNATDSTDPTKVTFPASSPIATDGTFIYSVYNNFCSYTVLRRTAIATGRRRR